MGISDYRMQKQSAVQRNHPDANPPDTISSALARMENVNERLVHMVGRLSAIAGTLGAFYPAEVGDGQAQPIAGSVVARLNSEANTSHAKIEEIESLISGIERALG